MQNWNFLTLKIESFRRNKKRKKPMDISYEKHSIQTIFLLSHPFLVTAIFHQTWHDKISY